MSSLREISLFFIRLFLLVAALFSFLHCNEEEQGIGTVMEENEESEEEIKVIGSDEYRLVLQDDFNEFNKDFWSKGMINDENPSVRMIWNPATGGKHLLNDNYAGYNLDENVYVEDGNLILENRKETIAGTDPVGSFNYSTGWMNSLQKINFNGTEKSIYLELKAKFPKGPKVWPAIWLIDDSAQRAWPPEVDIWEYFGVFFNPNWGQDQLYMRYIYGPSWQKDQHEDDSTPINNFQQQYNASEDWHVYGYQWTDTEMIWSIDGVEVHKKTKDVNNAYPDPAENAKRNGLVPHDYWPNLPMALVINNGLMSVVEEGNTPFPNALIIDYVALYQKK
ncbi:MAG: glycoside hydrolase family 16 protein [Saprospiraceae bacterium]|nr:glycoside hydrolase family 16 protein [Saprospiraceae bacterium]